MRPSRLGPAILVAVALAGGMGGHPAGAHPVDEYLESTLVAVTADRLTVRIDLTAGTLVGPELAALIDADGDGAFSPAEQAAYAATVAAEQSVTVDGRSVTLTVDRATFPAVAAFSLGAAPITVVATAALDPAPHELSVTNGHAPVATALQAAVVASDGSVELDGIEREGGATLRLRSTPTGRPSGTAAETEPAGRTERLLDRISGPISPMAALGVLLAAAALGGLHALTPGHGKTLIAASLVGTRGTVRDALTLGATVTVTHTASVVLLGLVAVTASGVVTAGTLVVALHVVSGLLVTALGIRLLWHRRPHVGRHDHDLGDRHDDHGHHHDLGDRHDDHGHHHDHHHGHGHHHAHHHGRHHDDRQLPGGSVPVAVALGRRELLALGASGGLVPCPEALGVLLVSVGLGRIRLGLALIVAFSAGLAAVLTGLGVLVVRSHRVTDRLHRRAGPLQRAVPFASAAVVTVLGVGMLARPLL